jgi:hypothetical protein
MATCGNAEQKWSDALPARNKCTAGTAHADTECMQHFKLAHLADQAARESLKALVTGQHVTKWLHGMWCDHDPLACNCAARPSPLNQNLDELSFARSACYAAQLGLTDKLERILSRNPAALHSDGGQGTGPARGFNSVIQPA